MSRNISEEERRKLDGMSRKTLNTIGGVYQENRGRRSADSDIARRFENSPFENGKLSNWNHRVGWDNYFQKDLENLRHGGALIGHDLGHRGKGPKGYKRSDSAILEDVCDMLFLSHDVDASDIDVKVSEGIVYLTGEVGDRLTKKMAELEIENVSGVVDVQNQLRFSSENDELH